MERTQVQIPAAQLDRQRDFEAKLKEMHAARPLRALVDTFGCQQNVADSQYIMVCSGLWGARSPTIRPRRTWWC